MNLSQMSMAAGAVIIAIVLIRAVAIDRLPKRVFLLLWGIALLRLLIPVSMPIQIALPTQSPPSQEQLVITASPREQAPETQDPVSRAADAPLAEHPSAAVTVESVLRLVWIAGMAATAGVFAAIYLKSKRRLR
ncbi:MAG: M56 family metallopeptidase, partial [Oscillospiraceae bacterium]|nr:M56 family metallopeptidase [Oscillospiraceae bacterium]